MNNIVIFEAENQPVQVRLEGETVWLTQAQIAELFAVTPQNVTMHLKNVFKEQELAEESTCKDFLQVQTEGDRNIKRKRKHYNLDAIISVGYRVNSRRATQFRQWATGVLRQHLVEGYTLNQQRLTERGIEFEQALALLVAESKPDQKTLMVKLVEHFVLLRENKLSESTNASPG